MSRASFQHWLAFSVGQEPDSHGRYINDIWRYSYDQLEMHHDYIEWLFANKSTNAAHPNAPIWNEDIWQACEYKKQVISSVNRSVLTMLRYWGIGYRDKMFYLSRHGYERQKLWLSKHNHNQQRITRMLSTLVLVGEPSVAQSINHFLRISATRHGTQTESVQEWHKAAVGML